MSPFRRVIIIGDATSQWINAVLFASSNANQSLSARCDEDQHKYVFAFLRRFIINPLFFCLSLGKQKDHCHEAWYNDFRRAEEFVKSKHQGE